MLHNLTLFCKSTYNSSTYKNLASIYQKLREVERKVAAFCPNIGMRPTLAGSGNGDSD